MMVYSLDLGAVIFFLLFIFFIVLASVYISITDWKDRRKSKTQINNEELCYVSDPRGSLGSYPAPKATGRFKHVSGDNGFVLHAEYEYWVGNAYEGEKKKHWQLADESDMELYYLMEYNERL